VRRRQRGKTKERNWELEGDWAVLELGEVHHGAEWDQAQEGGVTRTETQSWLIQGREGGNEDRAEGREEVH
jgi:hypothetical protein